MTATDPNLRAANPTMAMLGEVFGYFDDAIGAAHTPHRLDEAIGAAREGLAQVRVSLRWLAEGTDGAILRGEDLADIIRQIAGTLTHARDALDAIVAGLREGE